MPEYCMGCGKVFDLWSHLLKHAKAMQGRNDPKNHNVFDEFLCDECRSHIKLNEENVFKLDREGFMDDEEYEYNNEFIGTDDVIFDER